MDLEGYFVSFCAFYMVTDSAGEKEWLYREMGGM